MLSCRSLPNPRIEATSVSLAFQAILYLQSRQGRSQGDLSKSFITEFS